MKTFLTTLAVLAALAQPVFAQAFCTCDGTGNVLKFTNNPITLQNQAAAQAGFGQSGLNAFAMAPARAARTSDDPAATGGGSAGYNQNLRNY